MTGLPSSQNRGLVGSVAITAIVLVIAAVIGFLLLPALDPTGSKVAGLWDSICGAAGVPKTPSEATPVQSTETRSTVVLTSSMLSHPTTQSIGRGATLAQQCAICHGPTGVSRADSPNLAGQYASVIYKELKDFQSGARVNAVMSPFAAALEDQEMRDLAAYYSFLPRLPAYHPQEMLPRPRVVINGAPVRGIAPCGACHGSLDNKTGSPWLEGQSSAYLKSQLDAFASGNRTNDISRQMRNIATRMTPEEIDAAARYYASQPPDVAQP
jgi:cytochrome c553